ncbi:hydrolase, TatD family protein [Acanthamoeba castellanii str. Neff]|uniref:Hydrolase, TatD family protein n=1 Tax=Acanthamoeba castellanii (strain ATCC 30010 / Neff) TaxID=1257118 RepID=L8GHQ7_ACACF|nr:hydrolase, TatD family protein [Acanthamoeba castellanii str. Neff]ELR12394.1 hydrolase, TatD family protein [Acanthamoeba castellanii str. Neff]
MEGLTPYFDTHTHLDQILPRFKVELEGFPAFRGEYFRNGFGGCVTVSADVGSIEPVRQLLHFDDVYAAFGIHPHVTYTDEVERELVEAMALPKTLAWGEIGLDYHYNLSDPATQRQVFARQIQLAVQHNKPLVIHTREAEEDTLKIMKEHVPKEWRVHVHCFTSSLDMAKSLLDEWPNLFIGYTGVITFGASDLSEVVRHVPLERILLETDGPYMTPAPYRGKVCHSGHVPFIAKKVGELKGMPLAQVLQAARDNTRRMYGV